MRDCFASDYIVVLSVQQVGTSKNLGNGQFPLATFVSLSVVSDTPAGIERAAYSRHLDSTQQGLKTGKRGNGVNVVYLVERLRQRDVLTHHLADTLHIIRVRLKWAFTAQYIGVWLIDNLSARIFLNCEADQIIIGKLFLTT